MIILNENSEYNMLKVILSVINMFVESLLGIKVNFLFFGKMKVIKV